MKRYYALTILLVYFVFSCVAITSGKMLVESSAEGTEKEAVPSSAFEHRETSAFRLADKNKATDASIDYSYDRRPPVAQQACITASSTPFTGIPFYVLHCVYRL